MDAMLPSLSRTAGLDRAPGDMTEKIEAGLDAVLPNPGMPPFLIGKPVVVTWI